MRSDNHDSDSRMDEDPRESHFLTSDHETTGSDERATLKGRRRSSENISPILFSDDETVVGSATPSPVVQSGDFDRSPTSDLSPLKSLKVLSGKNEYKNESSDSTALKPYLTAIQMLCDATNSSTSDRRLIAQINLFLAGLEGETCDALKVDTLYAVSHSVRILKFRLPPTLRDELFSVVVSFACQDDSWSPAVQSAAIVAFREMAVFFDANLREPRQYQAWMQVLRAAATGPSTQVQAEAFKALKEIIQRLCDSKQSFMEFQLFKLIADGLRSADPAVAFEAVELCSAAVDVVAWLAQMDQAGLPEVFEIYGIYDAFECLLSMLLTPPKDAEDEELVDSQAAEQCLRSLAGAGGLLFERHITLFVRGNISQQQSAQRRAAVMSLGLVLDGSTQSHIVPLIRTQIYNLMQMLDDPDERVKVTTAWTLGMVAQHAQMVFDQEPGSRAKLVSALLRSLEDPCMIRNCCWALGNLAEFFDKPERGLEERPTMRDWDEAEDQDATVHDLLSLADKGTTSGSYTPAAYRALAAYMPHVSYEVLLSTAEHILLKMELLNSQLQNPANCTDEDAVEGDDMAKTVDQDDLFLLNWCDSQARLCSVLDSIISIRSFDAKDYTSRVMSAIKDLIAIAGTKATVADDAFRIAASLAEAVGDAFEEHVEMLISLLIPVLKEDIDSPRCQAGVNVLRRICGAVGDKMSVQAGTLIPALIASASRSNTCPDAVACILSSFVDIVTAVGSVCEQHLSDVLKLLAEAVKKDPVAYGEIAMSVFIAIIDAFKDESEVDLLAPHLDSIMQTLGGIRPSHKTDDSTRLFFTVIDSIACLPSDRVKEVLQENEGVTEQVYEKRCLGLTKKAQLKATESLEQVIGPRIEKEKRGHSEGNAGDGKRKKRRV